MGIRTVTAATCPVSTLSKPWPSWNGSDIYLIAVTRHSRRRERVRPRCDAARLRNALDREMRVTRSSLFLCVQGSLGEILYIRGMGFSRFTSNEREVEWAGSVK